MVCYDHINSKCLSVFDCGNRGNTVIHGHNELRRKTLFHNVDQFRREAVTLCDTIRNDITDMKPHSGKTTNSNRTGCCPVAVVVGHNSHGLAFFSCLKKTSGCEVCTFELRGRNKSLPVECHFINMMNTARCKCSRKWS